MNKNEILGKSRVVIAIPTYRRLQSLSALLGILTERAGELSDAYPVTAIVVDNDPQASARDLVESESWGVSIRYVHEPIAGIAAARSRLMSEASDQDLLAFIDDDEWPLPGWLSELVQTWEETGATAVVGRVETVLPDDVDPWVRAFGIFERVKLVPGERLPAAATGNLLLDLNQVRRMGVDFDPKLGTRGGEDTLFSRTLVARGGTIVACPGSVARDEPDADRLTREFTLKRARFHGVTQSDIDLRMSSSVLSRLYSRLLSSGKGLVWIGIAALQGVRGLLGPSLTDRAWSARRFQRGMGLIQGAWGDPPGEYARDSEQSRTSPFSSLKSWVRSASPFFRSVVGVVSREPIAVLTLDDGPDPQWTPLILDLLRDRGATATFFVLLTRTRRYPELLRRIVEEGHEVGLHGVDHRRATTMSWRDFAKTLDIGRRELEAIIGERVRWYRPPYGVLDPTRWVTLKGSGMTPVLWSTTALDGRDATVEERLDSATNVAPGDILLAHDSRAGREDGADDPDIAPMDRVELVAAILDGWDEKKLRAVSLGTALSTAVARYSMILKL